MLHMNYETVKKELESLHIHIPWRDQKEEDVKIIKKLAINLITAKTCGLCPYLILKKTNLYLEKLDRDGILVVLQSDTTSVDVVDVFDQIELVQKTEENDCILTNKGQKALNLCLKFWPDLINITAKISFKM